MPGDDSISIGLMAITTETTGGQTVTSHTRTHTLAGANLDEDGSFAVPDVRDDESRAVVTLTPRLPVATRRESSNFELILAPERACRVRPQVTPGTAGTQCV